MLFFYAWEEKQNRLLRNYCGTYERTQLCASFRRYSPLEGHLTQSASVPRVSSLNADRKLSGTACRNCFHLFQTVENCSRRGTNTAPQKRKLGWKRSPTITNAAISCPTVPLEKKTSKKQKETTRVRDTSARERPSSAVEERRHQPEFCVSISTAVTPAQAIIKKEIKERRKKKLWTRLRTTFCIYYKHW